MTCGGIVYSVDLSGDCKLLATGDQSKKAKVWSVETGTLIHSMPCSEVVKRVCLSGDSTMLATGAGDACHIWDLVSGTLIHSKETGGRVRLAEDKSMVVTVDQLGLATVWALLNPAVTAFWTPMGKHARALSSAARCVPSFGLVLYGSSPSGRSVAAHAATANNLKVLERLLSGPTADLMASTVLRLDCTGWHALDYALKNRNCPLVELLFSAALRLPPSARGGLVVGPPNCPPALVIIARLFPSVVGRQLQQIGLDPYSEDSKEGSTSRTRKPCIRRAPYNIFTLDHNKMSIAAADSPYPDSIIWDRLTKPSQADYSSVPPPIATPEQQHWVQLSLLDLEGEGSTPSKSQTDEVEGKDEVDAECGIVGIPKLLTNDRLIFMTLVEAAELDLDLISCDIMRTAIAFKWSAYGGRKWRLMVTKIAAFFLSYISSLSLLLDSQRAMEDGTASDQVWWWWLGLMLFGVTTAINVTYGLEELFELMGSDSLVAYFCKVKNTCDLASFANILLLLPLVLLRSPVAPVTGSFGTLLMLPKMAAVARGHERMSALVRILGEILVDMLPFLSLMGFVILANAFAFELLSPDDGEYSGPANAWFVAYSLTLGSFNGETYTDSLLMTFFFHYFTLFVNIVLLNVLIAIISDTYTRVTEKTASRSLLQRAQLLLELEETMPQSELDDKRLFPAWLHVLQRRNTTSVLQRDSVLAEAAEGKQKLDKIAVCLDKVAMGVEQVRCCLAALGGCARTRASCEYGAE